ncbi:MAG: 50S ribosomal protein L29 [Lentisphaeria bacterium]|jgi:large subunit ribosomal protein L29|nr:50S ribosomal protein L29 [Lentisphaerota bacterium]MBO5693796.1 50S ribosomal protein L29 [Lentisphaeria bacterium]MBQ7401473.1 50S ribosomal protein L29 [Lentisphaeria bacterium]MBR4075651.1 50S ribosomal protein L29 [Lentisphaeria bacterium]
MKMKLFKEMSDEELARQIEDLKKEKFNLRAQSRAGQLESPAKIRLARRDLARALTELNQRTAAKA